LPRGDDWVYEIKLGGHRTIATKDKEQVQLWSRNGNNRTTAFHAVAGALVDIAADTAVLDGEIVALD
jgi:bifunctional non-homologous end joining protein LigD